MSNKEKGGTARVDDGKIKKNVGEKRKLTPNPVQKEFIRLVNGGRKRF